MNTLTLGIDLAKNVFSLHGVNQKGKTIIRKTVKRQQLLPEVAKLPSSLIGMEACSGAHYWAREFIKLGHDARIMAPKYVAPYRQGEKNDSNDAEVICDAQKAIGLILEDAENDLPWNIRAMFNDLYQKVLQLCN